MRPLLALACLLACASTASAERFDPTGWKLLDLHLKRKAKKHVHEDLGKAFADGDTAVLDIGGKRSATNVRLKYKKHSLAASTRVQVYAR